MPMLEQRIVDLWADVGSSGYWADLTQAHRRELVPFAERWPQPGFVGDAYHTSRRRVVVIGQNPRASNTQRASESDQTMFRLIQRHATTRTQESLRDLLTMTRAFMLGLPPYAPAWRPISAVRRHLGLDLDAIAYLNLVPIATRGDLIGPAFNTAFSRSTKLQIDVLDPDRLVFFGKGAFEKFIGLVGPAENVRYIEQRNFADAPSVRRWLNAE